MPRFPSILSRIICLHLIAIGITAVAMPLVLYLLLNSAANDLHHRALEEHADTIARYLVPDASGGGFRLNLPAGLQELYSGAYGRYAYAILDGSGRTLFSSREDRAPIFSADARAPVTAFLETRRGDADIFGASIPKEIGGRAVWVQVAEDLAHRDVLIDDIVADFFRRVGWVTLPMLLVLLAIDIFIFRRALRPVVEASENAERIGPASTDVRLPLKAMPNEIRPLVKAVNQALDRLEQGFRMQREFTADAAHELRTPLTILRTRIDTLADKRAAEALKADIAGMSRIVSQLLDIAELETFVADPAETADLRAVAAEVAEFVAPLALAQKKTIALSGAEGKVWVRGNAETLARAIRNLAENAINYTPEGTAVEIVVSEDGRLSVLDRGPGVPEAERELVFRRFWRRDRRRAGSAGLGLAIVRRIVEAHAGAVTVENRAGGGAAFSLRFAVTSAGVDATNTGSSMGTHLPLEGRAIACGSKRAANASLPSKRGGMGRGSNSCK
jgi:signal transduction histidine kinase